MLLDMGGRAGVIHVLFFTSTVMAASAWPALLVTRTVYVALAATAVGIPTTSPVVAFKCKPAGRAGVTVNTSGGLAMTLGVELVAKATV